MSDDVKMLRALNQAYLDSVVNGDVQRFGELLSPDFLCSMPDGSLLDKSAFLREFEPDFFFDDQIGHCESARVVTATGHVLSGISNAS